MRKLLETALRGTGAKLNMSVTGKGRIKHSNKNLQLYLTKGHSNRQRSSDRSMGARPL